MSLPSDHFTVIFPALRIWLKGGLVKVEIGIYKVLNSQGLPPGAGCEAV